MQDDDKPLGRELTCLSIFVGSVALTVVLAGIFPDVMTIRRMLFLISFGCIAYAISGLFTGVLRLKFGWYSRDKNPAWFWTTFLLFFVIGVAMFVRALFLQ